MSDTTRRTRVLRTIPAAAAAALVGTAPLAVVPAAAQAAPADCPVLHAVLVPGTSETSPDADPDVDTGLLSTVSIPVSVAQPGRYDRTYITYPADFGFSGTPYLESVEAGVRETVEVIDRIARDCADAGTRLAISGFSQGAHIARAVAQAIGRGTAGINPELVASVSLFSDPGRAAGDGWFPGLPGQTTPAPAVGTEGENVSKVQLADVEPAAGRGIAPIDDGTFGELDGRVASFCLTGDLACSVPEDAPVARLIAAVAGRLDLSGQDPVRIMADITDALSGAVVSTAVAAEDAAEGQSATERTLGEVAAALTGDTAATPGSADTTAAAATAAPAATAAEAPAATTTEPAMTTAQERRGLDRVDLGDPLRPLAEFGNFLFGSAVTIAREVITPANIGELAMVGLADPDAALALLGQKLIGATAEVLPPARVLNEVQSAVLDLVRGAASTAPAQGSESAGALLGNDGLVSMLTDLRYWDTARLHNSYASAPVTPDGKTPTEFTAQWLRAVIADLREAPEDSRPAPSTARRAPATTTAAPETTAPAATTATTAPAATTTNDQ